MMGHLPLLDLILPENMVRGGLDLSRGDDQISRGYQAHELRDQQIAAFDVIVDPHIPISCGLGRHRVDDVFGQPKKLVLNHSPLPQGADLICNTFWNHRCKSKCHEHDINILAIPMEPVGTDLRFLNPGINAPPHSSQSQDHPHCEQRSAGGAREVAFGHRRLA